MSLEIQKLPLGGVVNDTADYVALAQLQGDGSYKTVRITPQSLVNSGGVELIGKLKGANMNTTADQLITLSIGTQFALHDILICNASVSLGNVVGAAFYATQNRASNQQASAPALHNLTTQTKYANTANQIVSITAADVCGVSMYFSLTTGQGVPATADIYVFGFATQ